MQNDTPLRQLKRQRTRQRIEDAATALVVKHGFDQVTIDDICRDAEISRRSFFNYMESKDEAVLGPAPFHLTEDQRAEFISTPSNNLVRSVLGHFVDAISEAQDADMERGVDEGFRETLRARRQGIVASEPTVALTSMNRFREQSTLLHSMIVEHLQLHPGDRKLPDETVDVEASILLGLIRESVWLHFTRTITSTPTERARLLPEAGATITRFAKELSW